MLYHSVAHLRRLRGRRQSLTIAVVALLATFWLGLPSLAARNQKQAGVQEVVGEVTAVAPTQVTVANDGGRTVAIATREDFTRIAAVGSRVTAWYVALPGGNQLNWLSYPLEMSFSSPARILTQVKSVVLMQDSQMDGASEFSDGVENFLQSDLHWSVAPREWVDYVRRQQKQHASTLSALDPRTGQFDLKGYLGRQPSFIPALARSARVAGVLEISLEKVQADVSGGVARWDGTAAGLSGRLKRTLGTLAVVHGRSKVPAVTAVMKLYDANGSLLWSNRRGLALLEHSEGFHSKLAPWPLANSLMDSGALDAWMRSYFASFLPPPAPGAKPRHRHAML